MDFSDALRAAKEGKRVRRATWKGMRPDRADAWLELRPSLIWKDGLQEEAQLMMCHPGERGVLRPFSGASTLLLAEDWEIVGD